LEKYHITLKELPKISKKDPAIGHLNVKEGDVVKVVRESPTAGEAIFYRGVINV
jgi:DNA-directed RNA polymerase subunit H